MTQSIADARGSMWRRWDPHVHAPGTLFADRYVGENPWSEFFEAVEKSSPTIEVLGVADYWLLDGYAEVHKHWLAGRMPSVKMVFPNVELRLSTATKHGAAINVHLLINPADADHTQQAQRLLSELTFAAFGETYRCNRDDLIRLGRRSDPKLVEDRAALEHGGGQFKVSPAQIREVIHNSAWATRNVLVAFASSSKDGTAGLQDDSSFTELRREIERMSRVVFSSSPNERRFWAGEGVDSLEVLERDHGGQKVCLHGSDAHETAKVGAPDRDRRTWVKGDPTFETLRQACIAPDLRAIVAAEPPVAALPHRNLTELEVRGADWWPNTQLNLNPGLIAIIGPRGSGKTALADFIASGAHADAATDVPFVRRAAAFLRDVELAVTWGDKSVASRRPLAPDPEARPRVRYLSQQFVERLCGADGAVSEELRQEIERVVFEANHAEQRAGATTFDELRQTHTRQLRDRRNLRIAAVRAAGQQIIAERRKQERLPDIRSSVASQRSALADAMRSRRNFVVGDASPKVERLRAIRDALSLRQTVIDEIVARRRAIEALSAAAHQLRDEGLPKMTRDLRAAYRDADLPAGAWEAFSISFSGEIDEVLTAADAATVTELERARGVNVARQPGDVADALPYVSETDDLAVVKPEALKLEAERLQASIGLDEQRTRQLQQLDDTITVLRRSIRTLGIELADATGAAERATKLFKDRIDEYSGIFGTVAKEEEVLMSLCEPLLASLVSEKGAMGSLSISVRRRVDVNMWVAAGEELFDLRRGGPFAGRGKLRKAADELLTPAWEFGSATDVRAAMEAFRAAHVDQLREHATFSREEDPDRYWAWTAAVSEWLMSAEHVVVDYAVEYGGVTLERLSPGTRGIVLLLLYVSIDRGDDRPLIIDQPEENLDPKSIFDELVKRFNEVRQRRQVIIVTHNANLVVNTDADQVIVADAEPRGAGELPTFRYTSGGLENPDIRSSVCNILEGGEAAFRERARRLQVDL